MKTARNLNISIPDPCDLLVMMKHLTTCAFLGIKNVVLFSNTFNICFPDKVNFPVWFAQHFFKVIHWKVVNLQSCWLMKIAPCQMVSAGFLFTVSRWGEWFPVDLRMRRCLQQRHGSSHDVVKSPGASTEATPPWSPREGQMKKSLRLGDCYHVSTVTH